MIIIPMGRVVMCRGPNGSTFWGASTVMGVICFATVLTLQAWNEHQMRAVPLWDLGRQVLNHSDNDPTLLEGCALPVEVLWMWVAFESYKINVTDLPYHSLQNSFNGYTLWNMYWQWNCLYKVFYAFQCYYSLVKCIFMMDINSWLDSLYPSYP